MDRNDKDKKSINMHSYAFEQSYKSQKVNAFTSSPRTLKTLKMSFYDFYGDSETCIFVKKIELIIKHRKTVLQKLCLMRMQKSGPWKIAKTLKNGKS